MSLSSVPYSGFLAVPPGPPGQVLLPDASGDHAIGVLNAKMRQQARHSWLGLGGSYGEACGREFLYSAPGVDAPQVLHQDAKAIGPQMQHRNRSSRQAKSLPLIEARQVAKAPVAKMQQGKQKRFNEKGILEQFQGPCFIKMLMPNHVAGAIIGKEGAVIGDIMMLARCQMHVSDVGCFFPGTTDRIVIMSGTMESLTECVKMTLRRLKEVNGKGDQSKATLLVKLVVPCSSVSGLIGHHGDKVKKFGERTHCRINVSGRVDGIQERLVLVAGGIDCLVHAVMEIAGQLQSDTHFQDNLIFEYNLQLPLGIWSGGTAQPADPTEPLIPAEDVQCYTKREVIRYLQQAAPREILIKHNLLGNIKNTLKSKGVESLKEAVKDTMEARTLMASPGTLIIRTRPQELSLDSDVDNEPRHEQRTTSFARLEQLLPPTEDEILVQACDIDEELVFDFSDAVASSGADTSSGADAAAGSGADAAAGTPAESPNTALQSPDADTAGQDSVAVTFRFIDPGFSPKFSPDIEQWPSVSEDGDDSGDAIEEGQVSEDGPANDDVVPPMAQHGLVQLAISGAATFADNAISSIETATEFMIWTDPESIRIPASSSSSSSSANASAAEVGTSEEAGSGSSSSHGAEATPSDISINKALRSIPFRICPAISFEEWFGPDSAVSGQDVRKKESQTLPDPSQEGGHSA